VLEGRTQLALGVSNIVTYRYASEAVTYLASCGVCLASALIASGKTFCSNT